MKSLALLLTCLALAGCATAPAPVVVPREVLVPVYSCPAVEMPAYPVLATPTSKSPADVVRAVLVQLEQLKADNHALRALLAPYTKDSTHTESERTK